MAKTSLETPDNRAIRLSPRQRKALYRRSDRAGLTRLAGHLGIVTGIGLAIATKVPFWPVLLPLQGIATIFLFNAVHETIHQTAFRSPWLNTAVSNLCGFLVLLPPVWFRHFHFAHHRYTNLPGLDTELAVPKPRSIGQYLFYLSGVPVWISQIRKLVANAVSGSGDPFVPERDRAATRREARAFLALYVLIAAASAWFRSDLVVQVWLLPIAIGQPFLRAYLLAEHGGCPRVADMLANSRTTFTNAAVLFITWNMPYHAEHHALPAVPFHRLPDFHKTTRPHLKVTANGFIDVHRGFIRQLRQGGNL